MDYIQQAIDKARKERDDVGGEKQTREAPQATIDGVNSTFGVPESIHYTKTRKVSLSADYLRSNRIIAGFEHDKTADGYRQLRTQVLQKLRANNWKTVAVTSPNENAGKTVTAINLAIALSREVNQTVLLVDLDLRKPSVLDALGVDAEYGLVDHLKGVVSVGEILVNPGLERLVILPGKADPNYSSEILSSPAMKKLMQDLTSRYESRIIIFDLPALLVNDDALAFTPFVDSALLVIEDGASSEQELRRSMDLLAGTNMLGTVLNKVT